MGSALSRTAARLPNKASSVPSPVKPKSASPAAKSEQNKTIYEKVSFPAYGSDNSARRKTSAEWGEALKQMSGVISTSAWQDDDIGNVQSHAAQRSDQLRHKLPSRASTQRGDSVTDFGEETGVAQKPFGRLLREDVLQIFNLRRADCEQWQTDALCEKFAITEDDMANLLSFTRTYLGRVDADELMRAYYNPDPENEISRFERD